mmetsp:Transcript_37114/g.97739  ORF Transcript_37114/g.97739 Transcript_37114/m.97739 type:complete len:581 (-) Transcript_37114:344-2086(-)
MQWAERPDRGGGHDRRPMWQGASIEDPRAVLSSYYEQILFDSAVRSPHPNDAPAGRIEQLPTRPPQRQPPPPPRQSTWDVKEVPTGRASAQERLEAMRVATRQAQSPSRQRDSPLHKPPGAFSAAPSVVGRGPPRALEMQGPAPVLHSPPPRLDATPDELREHFRGVFAPPRGPDLDIPLSPSDLSGLWALKVPEVQGMDAIHGDWAREIVGRSPSFLPSPEPHRSSRPPEVSRHGHRRHRSPAEQRRAPRSPPAGQTRVPRAPQAAAPGGLEACQPPSVRIRNDAWDLALQQGQMDFRSPFVHGAPRPPVEERPSGQGMPRRAWSASVFPDPQHQQQPRRRQEQQQLQQQPPDFSMGPAGQQMVWMAPVPMPYVMQGATPMPMQTYSGAPATSATGAAVPQQPASAAVPVAAAAPTTNGHGVSNGYAVANGSEATASNGCAAAAPPPPTATVTEEKRAPASAEDDNQISSAGKQLFSEALDGAHLDRISATTDLSNAVSGTVTGPMPSAGASLHGTGNCSPCAWFWKARGCGSNTDCEFCHMCPDGELKRRKKMKIAAIKMGVLEPTNPKPDKSAASKT